MNWLLFLINKYEFFLIFFIYLFFEFVCVCSYFKHALQYKLFIPTFSHISQLKKMYVLYRFSYRFTTSRVWSVSIVVIDWFFNSLIPPGAPSRTPRLSLHLYGSSQYWEVTGGKYSFIISTDIVVSFPSTFLTASPYSSTSAGWVVYIFCKKKSSCNHYSHLL